MAFKGMPNLSFPRTVNLERWQEYLGRPLAWKEKRILEDLLHEKMLNQKIKELHNNIQNKNLCIPQLTNLNGDCLFESLNYYGIGEDVQSLRKGLSFVMYSFKEFPNFFPTIDGSLESLFNLTNEIEVVYQTKKNNRVFYKYSYNVMCQDLCTKTSWTMLPTQLILMVVSYLFKADIYIYGNSSDYEININVFKDYKSAPPLQKIYLGHLGESHYLPLDKNNSIENENQLLYNDAKIDFYHWAKNMEHIVYSDWHANANANDRQKEEEEKDNNMLIEKVKEKDNSSENKDNTDNKEYFSEIPMHNKTTFVNF